MRADSAEIIYRWHFRRLSEPGRILPLRCAITVADGWSLPQAAPLLANHNPAHHHRMAAYSARRANLPATMARSQ
jgi:hypothetical protein